MTIHANVKLIIDWVSLHISILLNLFRLNFILFCGSSSFRLQKLYYSEKYWKFKNIKKWKKILNYLRKSGQKVGKKCLSSILTLTSEYPILGKKRAIYQNCYMIEILGSLRILFIIFIILYYLIYYNCFYTYIIISY